MRAIGRPHGREAGRWSWASGTDGDGSIAGRMWTVPLIRRNKRLARTMLYGSAVVLPLVASILVATLRKPADFDSSWDRPVEEYEALEPIRLLQEYLRLDTSAPDGNEIPGAELLARHLASVGVEAHIERIGTRNANLWAILEGASSRAIALHHHIDVEPIVHPEAWRHPPFDGVIEPPWIFGRGAFDMKSVAIAHLVAFLEIARSETRPDRSLMLLATGDEETGTAGSAPSWIMQREHPELVARFGAVHDRRRRRSKPSDLERRQVLGHRGRPEALTSSMSGRCDQRQANVSRHLATGELAGGRQDARFDGRIDGRGRRTSWRIYGPNRETASFSAQAAAPARHAIIQVMPSGSRPCPPSS